MLGECGSRDGTYHIVPVWSRKGISYVYELNCEIGHCVTERGWFVSWFVTLYKSTVMRIPNAGPSSSAVVDWNCKGGSVGKWLARPVCVPIHANAVTTGSIKLFS